MYCTKCGAQNEDNSKFCSSCGALLEVPGGALSETEVVNYGNCPHCGKPLEPAARFCVECGQSIVPAGQDASAIDYGSQNNRAQSTGSKDKKMPVLVAAIAVGLVVSACLAGVIFFDPFGVMGSRNRQGVMSTASGEANEDVEPGVAMVNGAVEKHTEKTSGIEEGSKKVKAASEEQDAKAEQAKREAEEQAKREAEEQAKREAEEQAKREAEEQAKREAEEEAARAEAARREQARSRARSFPWTWRGAYDGHNGDIVERRPITFRFTDVGEDGRLYGSVEIYIVGDNVSASYHVSGEVDWNTGYFFVGGTDWINSGTLDYMRNYEGYVDFSSWSVSGTTWNENGENYENWSASAS